VALWATGFAAAGDANLLHFGPVNELWRH
jgi:hypothetical protein